MKIISKTFALMSLMLVSFTSISAQTSKCPTATNGVYKLPAGQSLLYATESCFWDTFQGAKYTQKDTAVAFLKAMLKTIQTIKVAKDVPKTIKEPKVVANKTPTIVTESLINARIGWLHTWESTEFTLFPKNKSMSKAETKSALATLRAEATAHFAISYEINQALSFPSPQLPTYPSKDPQTLRTLTNKYGIKYGLPKCRWQFESCTKFKSQSAWDYVNPQLYNATVEGFVAGFIGLVKNKSDLKHPVPTAQTTTKNHTAFFNISTPTLLAVNLNTLGRKAATATTKAETYKAYGSRLKTYIDQYWTMMYMCSRPIRPDTNKNKNKNKNEYKNKYNEIVKNAIADKASFLYPNISGKPSIPSIWQPRKTYFPADSIIKVICWDKSPPSSSDSPVPSFDNKNIPHTFENNFMILGDLIFLYCALPTSVRQSGECKNPNNDRQAVNLLYEMAQKGENYGEWPYQAQIKTRMKYVSDNNTVALSKLIKTPPTTYPHCMTCHNP